MVSKASDDLPEPDSPVITVSLSRGISTSTFFRLCSRAPRMEMFFSIGLGQVSWARANAHFAVRALRQQRPKSHSPVGVPPLDASHSCIFETTPWMWDLRSRFASQHLE